MELMHRQWLRDHLKLGEQTDVIYDQQDERLEVLVPFVLLGLQLGEKVALLVEDDLKTNLLAALTAQGLEIETYQVQGQLDQPSLPPKEPDRKAITIWLQEQTTQALNEGYPRLRLALETVQLQADPPEIAAGLDAGLRRLPCTVLCLSPQTESMTFSYPQAPHENGDNSEQILRISASPIRDPPGQVGGAIALLQDVTTSKQVEKECREQLEALMAENLRLRTILNNLPVGVLVIDPQGQELDRNSGFDAIWGDPSSEIRNAQDETVDPHGGLQIKALMLAEMQNSSSTASPAEGSSGKIMDSQRFDGTPLRLKYASVPLQDQQGRPAGMVTILQDITYQQNLEREILQQRQESDLLAQQLETILSMIDIGIVVTDQENRIIRVNVAFSEKIGHPPDTLIGRPLLEFIGYPEDDDLRRMILETGQPQHWNAVKLHFPKIDTEVRYFDLTMAPFPDLDDQRTWILTTYKDITDHIRARQEAEVERARWLATLTTISLPVIFVDLTGRVRMANPPTEQIWQRPVVGESWTEKIAAEQPLISPKTGMPVPISEHPVVRALQGEAVHDYEASLILQNGKRIPILLYATPVLVNGQIIGAVQIGQDLTRLKEAERIKDQFLVMVSHDLRSPLSTIKGWALMAQQSHDEETIQKALGLILQGVQMQQRIIDDLLDSAALTIGILRITPKIQDLRPIVELFCQSAQATAGERGITLSCEVPESPLYAAVDAGRMHQILGNLFANAYKFTRPHGQITVRLFQEANTALLTVTDTGQGIPPEYLSHIFEQFYSLPEQIPTSRSLGLGLTIVKTLVEMQEGQVSASSEGIGKGSTFTIRLPLAHAGPEEQEMPDHA